MVIRSALHSQLKFSLSSREREYFYVYLRALLQALLLLYRVIEAAAHTDMELCSLASPSVLPEPHRSRTGTMRTCLKRTRSRAFVERVLLHTHIRIPPRMRVQVQMERRRRTARRQTRSSKTAKEAKRSVPSEVPHTLDMDNTVRAPGHPVSSAAASALGRLPSSGRATGTSPELAPDSVSREEGRGFRCLDRADPSRKKTPHIPPARSPAPAANLQAG